MVGSGGEVVVAGRRSTPVDATGAGGSRGTRGPVCVGDGKGAAGTAVVEISSG